MYARVDGEDSAKVSHPPAGPIQIKMREEWTRLHQASSSLPKEEPERVTRLFSGAHVSVFSGAFEAFGPRSSRRR